MQVRIWIAALAVALLSGCAKEQGAADTGTASAAVDARTDARFAAGPVGRRKASLLKTPLYFEPNVGQTRAEARFVARGPGFNLFLTPTGAIFRLAAHASCSGVACTAKTARSADVVRMAFVGANQAPAIDGLEPQKARSHYFIGNDPAEWHRNVGRYAKVRYRGLYPGVDAVFYGNAQALEYDFVVAPGADTGAIAFDLDGVRDVRVDGAGNLVMRTPHGALQQHKPAVYQQVGGRRVAVDGRYALLGGTRVGFRIGAHDPTVPVVIDPMFGFSTYLGGSFDDIANGIVTDADGNSYVVGSTGSRDMVPGEVRDGEQTVAFVTKFDPAGNVIYTSYVGGAESSDIGGSIAVDAQGRAYIAGIVSSDDFPVVNPLQARLAGGWDAFVTRLSADGSILEYSTYLGGSDYEGYDSNDMLAVTSPTVHIALDSNGSAYVTGATDSLDFPVVNALQAELVAEVSYYDARDAFVAKLSPDGGSLIYATYLGGSRGDATDGIAVDPNGNAYVVGRTTSPDFPVAAAMQGSIGAGGYDQDGFVAEISADGRTLVYSTYLGGSMADVARSIAIDADGSAYVAGSTQSPEFPFSSYPGDCPVPEAPDYVVTGFVMKINPLGAGLAYSACLKGANPYAIALNAGGNAFVTGATNSIAFPLADPIQAHLGNVVAYDAFVSKLAADGLSLLFSTYLGGTYGDVGRGIAVDPAGTIHVAGWTTSTDFPTTDGAGSIDPYQDYSYFDDAFVATIQEGIELSVADLRVLEGNDGMHQVTFNVHLSSASAEPVTFDFDTADIASESWAAMEGSDYEGVHARGLVIAPGETDKAIALTIDGDTTPESGAPAYLSYPGESFMVMLSNVVGATLRDPTAKVTLGNDDAVVSFKDQSVVEGGAGQLTPDTISVGLSARVAVPVTIGYTVSDGTAKDGSDYFSAGYSAVFLNPGEENTTLPIYVRGDDTGEPDETLHVALSDIVGATLGRSAGTLTIRNDDTALSIVDTLVVEGNSGTKMATFTISLTQPTVVPVTFNVATQNGTAAAGSDYTATSRTGVTIPAGGKTATVLVPVIGDTAIEASETFKLVVSNVVGATVTDSTAIGTIRNDDIGLSIADVSIIEGNSSTKQAIFTVMLSSPSAGPVTFNIATANKTAGYGTDYAARSLSAQTIPAGTTSKTFAVSVNGDRSVEANETFAVNVSGVKGATVTDAQAVGTIRNDDAVLSITDASATEGNSSTKTLAFTVKLSAASASPVTFNIATANKTAVAGSDYVALSLTGQSIPAGSTSKVFKVTVKGDTLREANETFLVNVGSVAGATVGDAQGLGTIVNDD